MMSSPHEGDDTVERGADEEMSGTPLTETEREVSERPPSQSPADDESAAHSGGGTAG